MPKSTWILTAKAKLHKAALRVLGFKEASGTSPNRSQAQTHATKTSPEVDPIPNAPIDDFFTSTTQPPLPPPLPLEGSAWSAEPCTLGSRTAKAVPHKFLISRISKFNCNGNSGTKGPPPPHPKRKSDMHDFHVPAAKVPTPPDPTMAEREQEAYDGCSKLDGCSSMLDQPDFARWENASVMAEASPPASEGEGDTVDMKKNNPLEECQLAAPILTEVWEMGEEIRRLGSKLQAQEEQLEVSERDKGAMVAELVVEVAQLRESLRNQEVQVASRIEALQARANRAEEELDKCRTKNIHIVRKLGALLVERRNEVSELKAKNARLQTLLEEAVKETELVRSALAMQSGSKAELKEEVATLRESLRELSERNQRQRGEVTVLREEVTAYERKAAELSKEVASLQADVQVAEGMHASVCADRDALLHELWSKERDEEGLRLQIHGLRSAMENQRLMHWAEIRLLAADGERLNEEVRREAGERRDWEAEAGRLQEMLKEVARPAAKAKVLEACVDKRDLQIVELQKALEVRGQKLAELQAALHNNKERNAAALKTKDSLQESDPNVDFLRKSSWLKPAGGPDSCSIASHNEDATPGSNDFGTRNVVATLEGGSSLCRGI